MLHKPDKRIRIIPAEEVQANLQEIDGRLPQDFRNEYPISSVESLEREFPEEWLAVLPTRYGAGRRGVAAGRFIAHNQDKTLVLRELEALQAEHPYVRNITVLFTGLHSIGGNLTVA